MILLYGQLRQMLLKYHDDTLVVKEHGDDFILAASHALFGGLFARSLPSYSNAIGNPPYKKINSNSGTGWPCAVSVSRQ